MLPRDALQGFVSRLTRAARQIAAAATGDAARRGGRPREIARAREELAAGDAADADHERALEHYRQAWKYALKSLTRQ